MCCYNHLEIRKLLQEYCRECFKVVNKQTNKLIDLDFKKIKCDIL